MDLTWNIWNIFQNMVMYMNMYSSMAKRSYTEPKPEAKRLLLLQGLELPVYLWWFFFPIF